MSQDNLIHETPSTANANFEFVNLYCKFEELNNQKIRKCHEDINKGNSDVRKLINLLQAINTHRKDNHLDLRKPELADMVQEVRAIVPHIFEGETLEWHDKAAIDAFTDSLRKSPEPIYAMIEQSSRWFTQYGQDGYQVTDVTKRREEDAKDEILYFIRQSLK